MGHTQPAQNNNNRRCGLVRAIFFSNSLSMAMVMAMVMRGFMRGSGT
jgi:hypothetical protein